MNTEEQSFFDQLGVVCLGFLVIGGPLLVLVILIQAVRTALGLV